MPQVINTNVLSLNAQRNLSNSQNSLATSLQRLSSGLRINSAKDDAAGLAISNRFSTQVRGLNVAVRNANDGISLAQTTEGALSEVTTNLQRIRDLAVQAANDTNSQSDRQSLQNEVDQLVSEIQRISESTEFNGKNILDGSAGTLNFQIGANANQTVGINAVDARVTRLGSQAGALQTTGIRVSADEGAADAGTQGIQEQAAGLFDTAVAGDGTNDDIRISTDTIAAVNIADAKYGGTISSTTTADLTNLSSANHGGGLAKDIAARINAIAASGDLAGVSASATTSFRSSDLNAADYSGTAVAAAGSRTVAAGSLTNGQLQINGVDVGPVSFQANDADGSLTDAINSKSDQTGVTASIDNGELVLTASDGRDIVLTVNEAGAENLFGAGAAGSFDAGFADLRVTGVLKVSAEDTITVASAGTGDLSDGGLNTLAENNVQGTGTIASLDITSVAGANSALGAIDSALQQVDGFRSELGAVQNRLESTIRNLSNVSENLSAANSRVLDADFAAETANLTKAQILQQAGVSVLSQANALPQQVLSLLG